MRWIWISSNRLLDVLWFLFSSRPFTFLFSKRRYLLNPNRKKKKKKIVRCNFFKKNQKNIVERESLDWVFLNDEEVVKSVSTLDNFTTPNMSQWLPSLLPHVVATGTTRGGHKRHTYGPVLHERPPLPDPDFSPSGPRASKHQEYRGVSVEAVFPPTLIPVTQTTVHYGQNGSYTHR